MTTRFNFLVASLAFGFSGFFVTPLLAQDEALATAKKLYSAAAYEDALEALERVNAATLSDADEAQAAYQYRALCLLALNRLPETQKTVEQMVRFAPDRPPVDGELPPRLETMFVDVRRKLLPSLARERYVRARARFDKGDHAAAQEEFLAVVTLLSAADTSVADDPALSDLKTLASGFLKLMKSSSAGGGRPAAAAEKESPAPVTAAVSPVTKPQNVVPPRAIHEYLPAWPREIPLPVGRTGALKLLIGVHGEVTAAIMLEPVHPLYDKLLTTAAKRWKYEPALTDDRPSPSTVTRIVRIGNVPKTDSAGK